MRLGTCLTNVKLVWHLTGALVKNENTENVYDINCDKSSTISPLERLCWFSMLTFLANWLFSLYTIQLFFPENDITHFLQYAWLTSAKPLNKDAIFNQLSMQLGWDTINLLYNHSIQGRRYYTCTSQTYLYRDRHLPWIFGVFEWTSATEYLGHFEASQPPEESLTPLYGSIRKEGSASFQCMVALASLKHPFDCWSSKFSKCGSVVVLRVKADFVPYIFSSSSRSASIDETG